jgi:aspartyl-tRNA(Asn)/glutamyl-tRNA(Gln) amidotransferase subunit A
MTELAKLSISEARDSLKKKEFTSAELTESCLQRINSAGKLNAFCLTTRELAMKQAASADKRLLSNDQPNMCGIPIGIKDLFCTEGTPAQAASNILDSFVPHYESTVTAKLWEAGSVMLGKLNMDEFAMGSSNETSVYGPAINPWLSKGSSDKLTPGGSSGGSAAAVAADLCLGATGTDTGGSIRQPASFTATVGLKPTYGRCSRWGIIAFASSLDQAGPITKTVRDSAIMLSTMSGHDPKDSTSAKISVPNFEEALKFDIKGKKIGIPREYRMDGMSKEIDTLWNEGKEKLASAGASLIDISLPNTKYALPAYYVIAPAEASSNLARYDGIRYGKRSKISESDDIEKLYSQSREEGFGAEVKRRIMIGTFVLSAGFYDAYYLKAQKVRTLIQDDFNIVFKDGIDAILTPTTPSSAFKLNDPQKTDPIQMYLNDIFTVTVNLAGLPAISIPTGLDKNDLPMGLQIIGRPWEEEEILKIGYSLEKNSQFNARPVHWW